VYNPNSPTSRDLGQKDLTLTFEDDATATVDKFSDTVRIGGLEATSQTVGVATQYSSNLGIDTFPADGILGLAFESISGLEASPVVESLITQGQLNEPVFSFKLAASGSELFMGGANSAMYAGDFTYTPVTQQGFWEVNVDSIDGNGATMMSNIAAIIDTGSSLTVLAPSLAAEFYQALGGTDASSTAGSGYYTFPCDSFPDISFTLGGTSFPMSYDTLNLGQLTKGSKDCVSSIVGQHSADRVAVIGNNFLRNVYTSFDIGNQQIGFAQLA
jgi:hypothetical protein